MPEKSLIYSMFMKLLDNGEDKEEEQNTEDRSRMEAGLGPVGHSDHRVETVDDWNETEERRLKQQEAELKGETVEKPEEILEAALKAEPEEEVYSDAVVEINVDPDGMTASMIVYEPHCGGKEIEASDIFFQLKERKITFGIDEEKVNKMAEEKLYRQVFIIAQGIPAVNGEDGKIKDYFPREHQLKYASKENGAIDFKSLNLIHNVKAGEVVCEITMPKPPKSGTNIFGNAIPGKNGTMPPIPQGKNIVYSPERDKLVTACEGNLTFRSGRFQVENVYAVPGDVDNSVGNIDFTGSVVIHGDVFEGYKVTAKGDITVMGIVEGATLKAGGSIILQKGMRGMKSGVLEAGEDITAKFLEDCSIYAKHDIHAEYIINSEVSCGNDMNLVGKRGAFIGGACSVFNCMNVRTVGASSHIATQVTLGITPQMQAAMEKLGEEMIAVSRKLSELQKDISYLTARQKSGNISDRQLERLDRVKLEASVTGLRDKKLKKDAERLGKKLREVGKSRLTAGEVHPGTVICIGDCKMNIVRREESCSFSYVDGEIRKGMR